jgi:hypothetical protein
MTTTTPNNPWEILERYGNGHVQIPENKHFQSVGNVEVTSQASRRMPAEIKHGGTADQMSHTQESYMQQHMQMRAQMQQKTSENVELNKTFGYDTTGKSFHNELVLKHMH